MRRVLVVFLLLVSTTAFAATDIVATYMYQDGSKVTIVTRDNEHIRMDTSENNYMLLQGDKIYSVSKDDDGQWMVMDMDQMKGFSSGGLASLFGGQKAAAKEYTANYKKTGQKEKISGYTGTVYNVEVLENGQVIRIDEVVLSSHSDLKQVNEAWVSISSKMGQIMGQEMSKAIEKASDEAKKAGYGGMLRYGDEMRLNSLKKKSLDSSYYQFPQGAQKVKMGAQPSFGNQAGAKPSDDQYPVEEDYPDPDRTSSEEQATQESVPGSEKSTEDEVKESVQKLFKGLFN